ncbi:MAG TPA: hypothetical protein VNS63_15610 [Blastocatellia bacterium]|nr:hypothetical protein [Blastocatellia bacterium]
MKKTVLVVLVLMLCQPVLSQQPATDTNWESMNRLLGKWVGEGSSELGSGSGYFSFEQDLRGKVLIRRNHSEYPATKDRPAYVHEDLMTVYADPATKRTRAFYVDTEGHVINYELSFSKDGNRITFLSEAQPAAPRYRLSYIYSAPGRMTVTLEMAQPGKPDEFQRIVEGKVRKVSP